MQKPAVDRIHRQRISLVSITVMARLMAISRSIGSVDSTGRDFGITPGSKDEDSGDATPGPEVIKLYVLNSTELEIYPAHKC